MPSGSDCRDCNGTGCVGGWEGCECCLTCKGTGAQNVVPLPTPAQRYNNAAQAAVVAYEGYRQRIMKGMP